MKRLSVRVLALALLAVGGCASPRTQGQPTPAPTTVLVHNPTHLALLAEVCAPLGCSDLREIRPGLTARFQVPPAPVPRLNVTARYGTRRTSFPADYTPGEVVRIELSVP